MEGHGPSRRLVVLPVVCDTLYLHLTAILTAWLRSMLRAADAEPGAFFVYGGSNDKGRAVALASSPDSVDAETRWRISRRRLSGFNAFDHYIEGVGAWTGVRLLVGPPKGEREDTRPVLLMIGSEVLHQRRTLGASAYDTAREILDTLAMNGAGRRLLETPPPDDRVKPSRVDLCCDHFGYNWQPQDRRRFARRGSSGGDGDTADSGAEAIEADDSWCFDSRKGRTLYIGSRRSESRFLRIYDKTAQAQHTGKLPWLEPMWSAYGWQPGMPMWRAEVEHGGGWLKQHGCTTLAHLKGCERALWEHYTTTTRHVDGRTKNLRMEAPSQVWSKLQAAAGDQPSGDWQWKPRGVNPATDMRALLRQAAGCLMTVEDAIIRGAPVLDVAPRGSGDLWTNLPGCTEARLRLLSLVSGQMDRVAATAAVEGTIALDGESRHVERLARGASAADLAADGRKR